MSTSPGTKESLHKCLCAAQSMNIDVNTRHVDFSCGRQVARLAGSQISGLTESWDLWCFSRGEGINWDWQPSCMRNPVFGDTYGRHSRALWRRWKEALPLDSQSGKKTYTCHINILKQTNTKREPTHFFTSQYLLTVFLYLFSWTHI